MRKFSLSLLLPVLLICILPLLASAQERAISGLVTDATTSNTLQGVTVAVKGTSKAAVTNQDGVYTILAKTGDDLEFTYIGYTSQTKSVGVGANVNAALVLGKGSMDEVVVTAYGLQRTKRSLSYQTQDIKGDEIAETQRDNWINALSGRVAGASITPSSGVPGASTTIILRGGVSLGGNNQPLFVIDGVPFDNQTVNQDNLVGNASAANRNSDYGNRAADINPNDIESITILKGPEATALYGSDGASGAIVITTKKGKAGKPTVNYDNSFRVETVYRFPKIQQVYGRGNNGLDDLNATTNPFSTGAVYAYFGDKYAPGTPLYDNVKAFFKNGFAQRHNLNVDGGSSLATYRLSVSYLDQEGVVPMTGYNMLSSRFGGSLNISPKVKLTTSANYIKSITDKATKGAGGYLLNLLNFPSDIDVREYQNPDGSRRLFRSSSTSFNAEFDNPFWDVNKNRSQDVVDRVNTNITLNYNPAKWLSISNILGMDFYSQTGYLAVHPQSRAGLSTAGSYSQYEQNTRNLNNVTTVTTRWAMKAFNNAFVAGFAFDNNKTRLESQKGERFYEADFYSINNTEPTSRDAKTVVLNDRKIRLFGNYTIDYNKILYLSFAGSVEGNSKLISRTVDKNPYYPYGSASMSFIFTDLGNFKEKVNWLSFGKLRASYGTTGKGPFRPYVIDNTFVGQLTTGGGYAYDFTGNNYGLKPEFTRNLEFGGEFRFLKDRISLDITRYSLTSKDQIIAARYSYGSGFVIKFLNGGTVENRGIEAILNLKIVQSKDFNWNSTLNFARNRGEVKKMPADLPTYYDSDTWVFGNLRSQLFVGASPGNLAGFSVARNYNGDVILSGTSGLPLSSGDFLKVGERQPDFTIGLINSFTYKGFNLSFNLDLRRGGDVWNGNEYFLYLTGLSTKTLDRETPIIIKGVLNDGLQNSTTPTYNNIAITPFNRSDYYTSSAASTEADFIESVNWMRMRDATLSYQLPSQLIYKTKFIKTATVFVTGTELFMITNYTGADPSVNANNASSRGIGGVGIDYGALSTPRGVNFGVRVNF